MAFEDAVENLPTKVAELSRTASSSTRRTSRGPEGEQKEDLDSPAGLPRVRRIPTRESSLRHSHGSSIARRNRRSYLSESEDREQEPEVIEDGKEDPETIPELKSEDPEEDPVTRRIRELKEQKRKRERSLTLEMSESPKPAYPVDISHEPNSQESESRLPNDIVLPRVELEKDHVAEQVESSAPSPAISQRVERSTGVRASSMFEKPPPLLGTSTKITVESPRILMNPPQRSNSKLLRRLSRPISPTSGNRHRRTFSYTISQNAQATNEERRLSIDSVDGAANDYISSPRLTQKVKHPQSGRIICFSEVGDPKGSVVFCCVGMGLTRYVTAFYDELAATLKLRLITPDRPGIGGSEAYADSADTPLGWSDDVRLICQHLKITKFSIMAHSAGAIYALATALRMPQHIRGRVHLLAPWIPPSQMSGLGSQQESLPSSALPYSQRFLRSLPTPFLKIANSGFLSATSSSITTRASKSPRRSRKSLSKDAQGPSYQESPSPASVGHQASATSPGPLVNGSDQDLSIGEADMLEKAEVKPLVVTKTRTEKGRRPSYDAQLTEAIWEAATSNANPAVDLLVCLERRQAIGFRYADVNRSVVIHHGSKDARVPVDNVKWLGTMMRRCEVRVLDGEGHGLMASATVMGNILMEMAKEWQDWNMVVGGNLKSDRSPGLGP